MGLLADIKNEAERINDTGLSPEGDKETRPFGSIENIAKTLYAINPNSVSKVVDENGEPLVVYRGAPYDPLAQEAGKGVIAPERYFTPDEQYAKRYEKGDGVTRAHFLNIRNPFDVRNERNAQRNLAQLIRDAKVAVDEVKSPASITSRSRRLLRKWQNTKRMAPHP